MESKAVFFFYGSYLIGKLRVKGRVLLYPLGKSAYLQALGFGMPIRQESFRLRLLS